MIVIARARAFSVEVLEPLLIPVLIRLLSFLIFLRFCKLPTKLLAPGSDVLISLNVVPLDALIQFPIANWAEVARMSIGLLQVVRTLHEALVPSAVAQSEHMAELVSGDFANSHKHGILLLGCRFVCLTSELLGESVD